MIRGPEEILAFLGPKRISHPEQECGITFRFAELRMIPAIMPSAGELPREGRSQGIPVPQVAVLMHPAVGGSASVGAEEHQGGLEYFVIDLPIDTEYRRRILSAGHPVPTRRGEPRKPGSRQLHGLLRPGVMVEFGDGIIEAVNLHSPFGEGSEVFQGAGEDGFWVASSTMENVSEPGLATMADLF